MTKSLTVKFILKPDLFLLVLELFDADIFFIHVFADEELLYFIS